MANQKGSFTARDTERLQTWTGDITATVLAGESRHETPTDIRYRSNRSLVIAKRDGSWYDHTVGKGGVSMMALLIHLKGFSKQEANEWARAWLASHPGTGSCMGGTSDDALAITQAHSEYAQGVLSRAVSVAGTPAEKYLLSRSIAGPYPECVKYIAQGRTGEGAIVGILTSGSEVVGVQLGYLDPQGRKSTVEPQRRLYMLDREKGQCGTFNIEVEHGGLLNAMVLAEGLEDALSLAHAKVASRIMGLPGIGRMQHFPIKVGAACTVFRDGDPLGSPADKALIKGMDHLLLQDASVRVTNTPAGLDANAILEADGPGALLTLVEEAKPADLSINGQVLRLSRASELDYELQRTAIAKKIGIRASVLDDLVSKARPKGKAAADADPLFEEPWEGEVDFPALLDAMLQEMKRYVVADEVQLAAAVVWCVHAHLVHSPGVRLTISPKCAIQAPDRGCGKSTLLEIIGCMSPRSLMASSISAAAVYRVIEAEQPTLLIDEVDRIPSTANELIAVLNSSHRRSGAFVVRTEDAGNGTFKAVRFSTWAAIAFAGINALPDTLQDRSIVINLRKALPGEVAQHLRDGSSQELTNLRRQCAAWAASLQELPDPTLPAELYNRAGDNWRPLCAIAFLGGERWREWVEQAALLSLTDTANPGRLAPLLMGIKSAFGEKARLTTSALIDHLLADPDEDWGAANRGRAITPAWLRERLTGVITPPNATKWKENGKDARGYVRQQFDDCWKRYLPRVVETVGEPNDAPHTPHPPQAATLLAAPVVTPEDVPFVVETKLTIKARPSRKKPPQKDTVAVEADDFGAASGMTQTGEELI